MAQSEAYRRVKVFASSNIFGKIDDLCNSESDYLQVSISLDGDKKFA